MPDEFADPIARLLVILSYFVHRFLPQRKLLTTGLYLKEKHWHLNSGHHLLVFFGSLLAQAQVKCLLPFHHYI